MIERRRDEIVGYLPGKTSDYHVARHDGGGIYGGFKFDIVLVLCCLSWVCQMLSVMQGREKNISIPGIRVRSDKLDLKLSERVHIHFELARINNTVAWFLSPISLRSRLLLISLLSHLGLTQFTFLPIVAHSLRSLGEQRRKVFRRTFSAFCCIKSSVGIVSFDRDGTNGTLLLPSSCECKSVLALIKELG